MQLKMSAVASGAGPGVDVGRGLIRVKTVQSLRFCPVVLCFGDFIFRGGEKEGGVLCSEQLRYSFHCV